MLQPFVKLKPMHLARLMELGKTFLVSQHYSRGASGKVSILLSDYDDPGHAAMHFNAVQHQPLAARIDLRRQKHHQKILSLCQHADYELYWCVVASADRLKDRLGAKYKEAIRQWINGHTDWKVNSGETVKIQFEVRFGELFLILKWRSQRLSLKFEEIERLHVL